MEPGRPLCELAFELSGQLWHSCQPVGDGDKIAGTGMAGPGASGQPFEISHGPQQPTQRLAQGPLLNKAADNGLALFDRSTIHQWGFDPAAQAAAAHGGEGAIDRPEQRSLQKSIPLGGGEFQIAAGLGIQHEGVAAVNDGGHVQGNPGVVVEGLGVADVSQQAADGLKGERQFRQAQAIEAGQVVVLQQSSLGFRAAEGGAAHRREADAIGTPSRSRIVATPEQFGRLQLGQVLMQAITALPLQHLHIAGAHIGLGQPPAEGLLFVGWFHHHRGKPVVASGTEHALLQHRARREDAGDVPLQQGAFGGGGFELIAEGYGIAKAN